jgi:hypothetical protein
VGLRWSRVFLLASMKVGLDAAVPQILDKRRLLRYAHREEVLSRAMVASLAGPTKFMLILILKIARRFDGGDDMSHVHEVLANMLSPM